MGFDGIIGHERQKRMLLSLLERERLPHAFLFSGPEGIGKKKVVLEFAKHIFCDKGAACGVCRPCIKVDRGSHPDILHIEKEESIGIEQSRGISREIYEFPYESQKRIIIIDNAERMTHEAKNALLKTLEEPPAFNIFFLVTPSERDIPLTIRSRCMKLIFSPLRRERLKEYFTGALSMDNEKAELLSHISHGSIGSGLFWMTDENLSLRIKIAELVIGKNKSFLRASMITEKIAKNQRDMAMYLSFILSLYRDMYCASECGDVALIVNKDMRGLLEWKKVSAERIKTSIERVEQTISLLRYNVNKWLIFENLMLSLMESA